MQFLPKHVLENSNALCSEQGGHPFFCHREYLQGEWMQLCNWSIGNIFSRFQVAQLFFQSLKWCSCRLILWPCCCELIACAPLSTAVSARAAVMVVGSLPSSHHGHSPGLSLFSSFDQPTQAGSSSPIKKKNKQILWGIVTMCLAHGLQLHLRRFVFPWRRCSIRKNTRAPQTDCFSPSNHRRGLLPVVPPSLFLVLPRAPTAPGLSPATST